MDRVSLETPARPVSTVLKKPKNQLFAEQVDSMSCEHVVVSRIFLFGLIAYRTLSTSCYFGRNSSLHTSGKFWCCFHE